MEEGKGGFGGSKKKHILSVVVLVGLVLLTFYVLKTQGEEIHFKPLVKALAKVEPLYVLLAVVSMLLFVVIEGRCLAIIAKELGYRLTYKQTTVYAAADIYFSAITPSASGGQPASAYYMVKDGMKGSEATMALVLNILMFTTSLLLMGTWALVWKFDFLLDCGRIFKLLYVIGFVTQLLLLLLCLLCMFSSETIRRIGRFVVKLLYKIKFIKNKEKKMEGINAFLDKYESSVQLVKKKPFMMVKVLVANVLQRVAFFAIGYFVYLSFGMKFLSFWDYMALQLLLAMAVNSLPVPGAVGVSEGNFLVVFKTIYGVAMLMPAMILTRLINYYICFILCGIATLCYHVYITRRDKKGKTV